VDKVIRGSQSHATKIANDLRENVVDAVENLLQGIIDARENHDMWEARLGAKKIPSEKQLKKLFDEGVYFLYRILFILYAESRDLLPIGESAIYREGYSLEHLRALAEKHIRSEDYDKSYYIDTVRTLCNMLFRGYPSRNPAARSKNGTSREKGTAAFRIPPYNGRLFSPERTLLFDDCHVPDRAMREVIRALSLSRPSQGSGRRERYSYADLGVDQLGSIYEGLLVYEPAVAEHTLVKMQVRADIQYISQEDADEYGIEYDANSKKTAGSFYLKLWGGRRKGSGSYYTNREITAFFVKDALTQLVEPIIEGCMRKNENGNPRHYADEILQIKVCDPAMGSGAFLVQACRYLGEAYGRALAAEQQHKNMHISAAEMAIYKRRVAEMCLYGVDENALAVELAKVSLWLETLAQDRPLTFLDAHLRHGNSLIGAPIRNHMGEFDISAITILPARSFNKVANADSKDHGSLLDRIKVENAKQIKKFESGQDMLPLFSGAEVRHALADYKRLRRQMELSDEDKSMEEAVELVHHKQELLEQAFSKDRSKISRCKQLCDLWCVVWFWPLDSVLPPPTTALYRNLAAIIMKRPNIYVPDNTNDYLKLTEKIAQEMGFFHWELEFPEIWCDDKGNYLPDGGFDVVVGNPPWDKVAPNSKEFWSNYIPNFRTLGKQVAARTADKWRNIDPHADKHWRRYLKQVKQLCEWFKLESVFAWQGKGQINTYKLFVERMLSITRPNGICSMVLPASLYIDEGCAPLRRLLFFRHKTRFMLSIENRGGIFPIDSRFKVIFLSVKKADDLNGTMIGEGSSTDSRTVDCLFLVGKNDVGGDLAASGDGLGQLLPQLRSRLLHLPARIIEALTPDVLSLMEFKSQREIDLVANIYATFPPLGERRDNTWNVLLTRELDMTNDSHLFREGVRLRQFGAIEQYGRIWKTPPASWYRGREGKYIQAERVVDSDGTLHFLEDLGTEKVRYIHSGYLLAEEADLRQALPIVPDETYVPLYEGRMVHQFDHAAKAYMEGSGRGAKWRELGFQEKEIVPHYFVAQKSYTRLGFRAGFCDVTGPTNERSMMATIIPPSFPCGHTVSTVVTMPQDADVHVLWVALMNSFIVDWLIRMRVSNHVSFFLLESLALPRPKIDSPEAQALIQAAIRLTCITPELAEMWRTILCEEWQKSCGVTDMLERAYLRAEIDAVVADLYAVSEHDFAYILSTFSLLDRDQASLPEERQSFITRDLALLMLFQRRGKAPPTDIVAFYKQSGVDIRERTGPMIDLIERVRYAIQKLGAIAYQPSVRDRENGKEESPIIEQDELDFEEEG